MFARMLRAGFGHRRLNLVLMLTLGTLMLSAGLVTATGNWQAVGAQSADALRNVIGDEAVAQLEMVLFQAQDALQGVAYRVHAEQPSAPWQDSAPIAPPPHLAASATAAPAPRANPGHSMPAAQSAPTASAPAPQAQAPWAPAPLRPLGTLNGEGQWQAYLQRAGGQVVAYRTFLQPDPARPYVVAAVVAFDLSATRLHFVLGSQEPDSAVKITRTGRIPASDLAAGTLLAAFNGGFKARHGHFGAMAGGAVALPARDGLGTVAIYRDGSVRLGAWGSTLVDSPDMVAWRQNGPLIVQDGQINPHTADYAPQDWGYTVNNVTVTWRSALGLSADGRTLYYLAGPGMTLPVLASAAADTGTRNAIQLDINNYWVHFEAYQADGSGKLQAAALLDTMHENGSRFLNGDARDYFYITAVAG